MKILDFLGGRPARDGEWEFQVGRELHGAFGGANGGVVAAVSVRAARAVSPGRIPASVDARFLRGLTAGAARVIPTAVHTGRTLTVVGVDIYDERGKHCTRSTVTLVAPEALADVDDEGRAGKPAAWLPYAEGEPWPQLPGLDVPLIRAFEPRRIGSDERGIATAVRVRWDEPGTCAEAACIAADISVGPPVGDALRALGRRIPLPNPDLSLRFCAEPPLPRIMVSAARLERIAAGLATTRIEVRTEARELVAVGVSTTTALAGSWPDATKSLERERGDKRS